MDGWMEGRRNSEVVEAIKGQTVQQIFKKR
jgi:hypothetical protein